MARKPGYLVRNIMKAYQKVGKRVVTANELREANRILYDHYSDTSLSNVLSGLGWILVQKVDTVGVTGSKNQLSLWRPPRNRRV